MKIFLFTGVTLLLSACSTHPQQLIGGTNGIHPISPTAVYIAGDNCTINAPLSRSVEELRKDFEGCIEMHVAWQKVSNTASTAENE